MTQDLTPHVLNDFVHVVLVETEDSLNIGSVARAMKNLGFSKLHLVAPVNFQQRKAEVTGRWAKDIVESAQFHDSLPEALGGMHDVVGFSGREGKNRFNLMLPEWVADFRAKPMKTTALVFGPEDTGLRTDHIEHCHWLVRIPSTTAYPSFNLAQAVLLALFELTRQDWASMSAVNPAHAPDWNDFYQLDRLVDRVLTDCGFFREGTPEPIPGLIKNLFRRIQPDKREIGILLALFARLERGLSLASKDSPGS